MNFWAGRLGVSAEPQQAPAPAQVSQRPWFLSDFAQAPAQATPEALQQPNTPEAVPEDQNSGWGTVQGSKARARSASLTDTCPNCGSGNVFRPTPNAMLQCYECGHNPRFTQTGGEGGLPSGEGGPATPARQLATGGAGGVSQFNPQTIIARVGG